MSSIIKSRNIGLDIFRTLSISCVFVSHLSILFSSLFNTTFFIQGFGYLSVEFFFVLSGLLIGRILIKVLEEKNDFLAMKSFLIRRWLRTLPLYYLVLIFLVTYHSTWHFLPHHLFFLQNFSPTVRNSFFGVSWSLVVEEWFYLISALVLFSSSQWLKRDLKIILLVFCLAIIAMGLLGRMVNVSLWDSSYSEIRQMVFIRLDAPVVGVFLAVVEKYYPPVYNIIVRYRFCFLTLSLVSIMLCLSIFLKPVDNINSFFERTLFFNITPVLSIPLLVTLQQANFTWLGNKGIKLFTFLSTSSYAVYLVHWEVMQYLKYQYFSSSSQSINEIIVLCFLILIFTYSISYLLMKFWEKPFLKLRDSAFFNEDALYKTK